MKGGLLCYRELLRLTMLPLVYILFMTQERQSRWKDHRLCYFQETDSISQRDGICSISQLRYLKMGVLK